MLSNLRSLTVPPPSATPAPPIPRSRRLRRRLTALTERPFLPRPESSPLSTSSSHLTFRLVPRLLPRRTPPFTTNNFSRAARSRAAASCRAWRRRSQNHSRSAMKHIPAVAPTVMAAMVVWARSGGVCTVPGVGPSLIEVLGIRGVGDEEGLGIRVGGSADVRTSRDDSHGMVVFGSGTSAPRRRRAGASTPKSPIVEELCIAELRRRLGLPSSPGSVANKRIYLQVVSHPTY